MRIAYSYSRVSSAEQLKGGGLERQLRLAKDYCKKHGYILDESTTFTDKGKSAFKGANADTGKLGILLKLISEGKFPKGSVLLVENLDRLARTEALAAMDLFTGIINAGVTVVTLSDEKVYSKETISAEPTSLLISLIYFIRSNDESKQKQARITDAWRRQRIEKIRSGIKDKHNIPSWLTLEDNVFSVRSEKLKIINRVFTLFVKERLGVNSAAKRLNAEKVPSLTGRKWNASTVKFTLRNRALIGEYHVGERETRNKKKKTGLVIRDYYPRVIDQETFDAANRNFLLNPAKKGRPKVNKEDDWLTSLMKCGYCGGAVGAEHHATSKSYICWRSINGGCVRCGIDREWTQWAVKRVLRDSAKEYVATMPLAAKIRDTEAQIAERKAKVKNLVRLVEDGDESAVERALTLRRELRELEAKLAQLSAFSSSENVELTPETVAGVSRRYISRIRVFFAGDEKQRDEYASEAFGKSGGHINKFIRPRIERIQYLEVYFNAPWEERGWRVMRTWTTLPKVEVEKFKVTKQPVEKEFR